VVNLTAAEPRAIAGVPGTAFHSRDLGSRGTLYLPLGRRLRPSYAEAVLHRLLDGPEGTSYFWREDGGIVPVPASALVPLTRREWRARRGG
jgi:hypothetical protein